MKNYSPVGLINISDLSRVSIDNFNAISASSLSTQTQVNSNINKISGLQGDVSDLQARSSLTYAFTVGDVVAPLVNPASGSISIDAAGKNIKVSIIPAVGGVNLNLKGVTAVEVFGNQALSLLLGASTGVTDSTTYFDITFTNATAVGVIAVADVVMVTFHWQ